MRDFDFFGKTWEEYLRDVASPDGHPFYAGGHEMRVGDVGWVCWEDSEFFFFFLLPYCSLVSLLILMLALVASRVVHVVVMFQGTHADNVLTRVVAAFARRVEGFQGGRLPPGQWRTGRSNSETDI